MDTRPITATKQRIARLLEAMHRCGIGRSQIYNRMNEGTFPRSIKLGKRGIGWREADLDFWLADPQSYRADPVGGAR